VHLPAQERFDGLELSPKPLGNGLALNGETAPFPSLTAEVSETQKIKRVRFALTPATPTGNGKTAELNQAGFIGMKRQTELHQADSKIRQEAFRITSMLEAQDEVVSVADDDHIAAGVTSPPSVCPQVQHVMEEHVSKKRRNDRTLRSSNCCVGPLTVLGYPSPKPFSDQAEYTLVGDSMLDEFQKPSVVDGIEKGPDVSVEHPVHVPCGQTHEQSVQRIMRAAPRSETIRKPKKVHLVDGVEDRYQRVLNELILQGGNAKGTHASIRLGNVGPLGGPGTITPTMNTLVQVVQPGIQSFPVLSPGDAVNTRGGLSLKSEKA
jgi:hypothetical protein